MQPSLKTLKRLARSQGATVTAEWDQIRVTAPRGKRWRCDECHEIIEAVNRHVTPDYQDMLQRMSFGLIDCNCNAGEWCECYDY